MTAESARRALFTAIDEARFDCIPGLAKEYKQAVHRLLVAAQGGAAAAPKLERAVEPLTDALQYLRLMRAHHSARFQKLVVDTLYRPPTQVAKGRTLAVDA